MNVYEAIIEMMKNTWRTEIAEADANPGRWYELFVSEGKKAGTHTVESGDTFERVAAAHYEKYAREYGVDRTYIDIWQMKSGSNEIVHSLYDDTRVYDAIREHLVSTDELRHYRMVGERKDGGDRKIKFLKDHHGEGCYYYDGIARAFFRDRVFYLPEHSGIDGEEMERTVPEDGGCDHDAWSASDIIELCKGDMALAGRVMDSVAWAGPETELEQILASEDGGNDDLMTRETECETIDVLLTHDKYPVAFERKVRCVMSGGMSRREAEEYVRTTPICLEVYYDIGRGLFAVESEAVDNTEIFNPYTGETVTKEEN